MSEEKKIRLRCERVQAGVSTPNGRIYSREALQHMVDRVNEKGPQRRMLGKIGQDATRVTMRNASHLVLSARLDEDDRVSAEIEPLDTEAGRALSDLLASGEVEIVPAGIGSTRDGVVGEDYKFIRFDVVREDE